MHRRSHRRAVAAAFVSLIAFAPAAAQAVQTPAGGAGADARFLDVRLALRGQAAPAVTPRAGLAARSATDARRVATARAGLTAPRDTVLDVDPLTGSVASLQRLDGALTTPSGAAPATIARDYASRHAPALGLDAADVAGLRVGDQVRSATGLTVVRFGQAVDGIPTFDNGLQVGVDHAGRVLLVTGAPRSDLPASVGAPQLSAAEALASLQDEVGIHRAVTVRSTGTDARRTTTFSTGDTARLVLFGARGVRLAWHLSYAAANLQHYDAVVDATTGQVLYRANLVKFLAPVPVYHNHPGAPNGGTRTPAEDITPFLDAGATRLTGPNVHAFADVNDDDVAQAGEEVTPGTYAYNTAPANLANGVGSCDAAHQCVWNHSQAGSWLNYGGNAGQWKANVVQTFWYANHFHDHLAGAAIGFTPASGSFEGDDPLSLNALDGAATGPDADHVDNANMLTGPDGTSPRMQMYLFDGAPFRDVDGGDDAAVLYHEYTHGLSSRLVTTSDGSPALNSQHAGAMGEAWSDWYAQDLLVREGLIADTPADGEVDMGRYTDSTPHTIRRQALDCAVGSASASGCPAPVARGSCSAPSAGPGGFTLGDFGRVCGHTEVHADGEIWAQTLWEIREKLVARYGNDSQGSDAAERLITDAMRLSPPEPSFLDMRNAILAADVNFSGGGNRDLLWDVFARRGMGFYAGVVDSSDAQPAEDFHAPPPAGAPTGTVEGRVTDRATGLPLAGVKAGIAGLSTDPSFSPYLAGTSRADGRFTLSGIPQGSYPKAVFALGGYDRVVQPLTVGDGTTSTNAELVRDWAAAAGGAAITGTTDDTGAPFGCGAAAAIDQSPGAGWSAFNPASAGNPLPAPHTPPSVTIRLPAAITIDRFGMDPSATCGDDATATTKDFRVETSPDGVGWTTAAQGAFAPGDAGTLKDVVPSAGATGVRYVRLTLLSPQRALPGDSGEDFIDFSELEIYGNPPNQAPAGALVASATSVTPGSSVSFDASSFTDPDSAITGYDWDFDGDGTIDATTTAPTAAQIYAAAGTFTPTVLVRDFRGGVGAGSVALTVAASTSPPLTPPRKARPSLVLPRTGTRGRVTFKVTCKDPCRLSAELRVTTALKRHLHLRSVIVGRLTTRTVNGTRTLTVSLTQDARKRLRKRHTRRLRVALRVAATVAGPGGSRTNPARGISLRL